METEKVSKYDRVKNRITDREIRRAGKLFRRLQNNTSPNIARKMGITPARANKILDYYLNDPRSYQ